MRSDGEDTTWDPWRVRPLRTRRVGSGELVNLEALKRNAAVLPISERGFGFVLEDLDDHRDLDPEGFLDGARYGIRAIGALLPAGHFDLETLADVLDLSGVVSVTDLLEVVEARGEYEGEVSATALRAFLGLVDDGVRPNIAAKFLRMDEDEFEILCSFLDLWAHWSSRVLDRVHVLLLDGRGTQGIREELNVSRFGAWRLARWGRRTTPFRPG